MRPDASAVRHFAVVWAASWAWKIAALFLFAFLAVKLLGGA